jgi:hypothetical protein
VIRVVGLYLVGAWLLMQVAGTVLPMLGAPQWLPGRIVILLALGFIPALITAGLGHKADPLRSDPCFQKLVEAKP